MCIACAVLAACGRVAEEPLTFRLHLAETPVTLDPATAFDVYSMAVIDRLFDGLVAVDRVHSRPAAALAESWSVSADGRVIEFRLADGARFHNGRRIVAQDVKDSWERAADPAVGASFGWIFDVIEGREQGTTELGGLVVVDDRTLRVHLSRPSRSFLSQLTLPVASVVPGEEVERLGARFAEEPVGSGPFRFVRRTGHRVELEGFTDHHLSPPQVERLVFEVVPDGEEAIELFRSGRLDLMRTRAKTAEELQGEFPGSLRLVPGFSWYGFCFRSDREPFDDPAVRRAVALAVDRRSVAADHLSLSVGFVPGTLLAPVETRVLPERDLVRARLLLTEAGLEDPGRLGGLRYGTTPGELNEKVAGVVIDACSQLGFDVSAATTDFASLQRDAENGVFPLFRFAFTSLYPDPSAALMPLFRGTSRFAEHSLAYRNPTLDRLLERADTASDPEARSELYRAAQEIVIEDAPCVALLHPAETALLRPVWQGIPVGFLPEMLEIEKARLEADD